MFLILRVLLLAVSYWLKVRFLYCVCPYFQILQHFDFYKTSDGVSDGRWFQM